MNTTKNQNPSGLYSFEFNGLKYFCWFSQPLGKCGVGWRSAIVAMSDRRHLLGKFDELPDGAELVAPKKNNSPLYQRYQNLVHQMLRHG